MEEIIRIINSFAGYNPYSIFADWVSVMALTISNRIEFRQDREQQYLAIIKKYSKEEIEKFMYMHALLVQLFETELSDYLGAIYMSKGLGSNKLGQFFTPFHICLMNAKLCVEKGQKKMINEPSCGAGGLIIAYARAMKENGDNYQELLKCECSDLDVNSCYMTYVQLSLAGINAKVKQQNALNTKIQQIFYTPEFFFRGATW